MVVMKEHIQREMVNELRDVAKQFYDHGSLRERLSQVVNRAMQEQVDWETQLKLDQDMLIYGISIKDGKGNRVDPTDLYKE